jgi:integrase/recombinase XerD
MLVQITRSAYPERNRALFMLGLSTGMRIGELAALNVNDVVDANGKVREQVLLRAHQTKGHEARSVLLNTQAQAELERYLRNVSRKGDEPLFISKALKRFSANSLCQVMGRLYDGCGLDAATSHSTRRTFITNLAHKGVNVRVLAALAGHSSISTTQRYIDLNDNVLRAAVEIL